ncbi:MAG: DUF3578 domain-containing protein, partial [Acetobacterium sp.]|nr:DUF3578 domain-containing protein [Bacillota bacterium]MCG2730747.1 DUF3578 domain-containing protein [Acetobacterium sp.]
MSWELLESDRIIKTMELSDFINTEMMIPKELIRFFGSAGERLAIIYQNREYPSYLETEGGNAKLKWSKVLIRKLGEAFPDYEVWFNGNSDESKTPKLEVTKANEAFVLRLISGNEAASNSEAANSDGIKPRETVKNSETMQSGLSELLKKWIAGYPNYYPRDFRFSFKDVINEEIPKVIENFEGIKSGNYKILGFAGDTQWAEIPWVKVTAKQLQNINDDGLYLAYILAMDSCKLYLAIIYGADNVGVRSLSEKATEYRNRIQTGNYQTNHKEVLLANATLVSGIVCYREYTEAEMPDDGVLENEFEDFRKMYDLCLAANSVETEVSENQELEELTVSNETNSADQQEEPVPESVAVVPLPEEQTVEIVLEDFSETTRDSDEKRSVDAEIAKPMTVGTAGDDNQIQTTKDKSEKAEEVQDDSVDQRPTDSIQTSAPSIIKEQEQPLKAADSDLIAERILVEGGTNQRIEEELNELTQTVMHYPVKNDYLPTDLQLIQAKMGNKGYYYPAELIKSYYLSIKSKPFVMIRGRVGSGKTSFPRLFAEAIGANSENGRFKRVVVGKHWEDNTHLWGQLDSRGHFIPGP